MRKIVFVAGYVFAAIAPVSVHAQVSDNVIRIGVLTDLSGIYSDINGEGSVTAARLAAEEFGNELAGARIEIVAGDHQNKADIAANLARSWIDTDKGADISAGTASLSRQEVEARIEADFSRFEQEPPAVQASSAISTSSSRRKLLRRPRNIARSSMSPEP